MTELRNVTLANGTVIQERYFEWNSRDQGLVLSSFFYGYILTQFLGGLLGAKIGGHIVILIVANIFTISKVYHEVSWT